MKFIAKILLMGFMITAVIPIFSSCNDDRQVINVFNWGEYISDASGDLNVLKEFEAETGIKVNYTTYATNEELYSKLKAAARTMI